MLTPQKVKSTPTTSAKKPVFLSYVFCHSGRPCRSGHFTKGTRSEAGGVGDPTKKYGERVHLCMYISYSRVHACTWRDGEIIITSSILLTLFTAVSPKAKRGNYKITKLLLNCLPLLLSSWRSEKHRPRYISTIVHSCFNLRSNSGAQTPEGGTQAVSFT